MKIIINDFNELSKNLIQKINKYSEVIIFSSKEKDIDFIDDYNVIGYDYEFENIKNIATDIDFSKKGDFYFIGLSNNNEKNILDYLISKHLGVSNNIILLSHDYLKETLDLILEKKEEYIFPIFSKEVLVNEILNLIVYDTFKIVFFDDIVIIGKYMLNKFLDGLTIDTLVAIDPDINFRILFIERNDKIFFVRGQDQLKLNDKLYIITYKENLKKVINIFSEETEYIENNEILSDEEIEEKKKKKKNIIFIGNEKLIMNIVTKLNYKEFNITILTKNPASFDKYGEKTKGLNIYKYNLKELQDIEKYIEGNDIIVNLSNNDENNIMFSIIARELGIKKIISLVNNPNFKRIYSKLGIDCIINENDIIVKHIIKRIKGGDLINVSNLRDDIIITEVTIENEKIENMKIKDLKLPKDVIIVSIIRDKKIIIPKGSTILKKGDLVRILSYEKTISKVENLFKGNKFLNIF